MGSVRSSCSNLWSDKIALETYSQIAIEIWESIKIMLPYIKITTLLIKWILPLLKIKIATITFEVYSRIWSLWYR